MSELKNLRRRAELLQLLARLVKKDKAQGERPSLSDCIKDAANVAEQASGALSPTEARDIREWLNAVSIQVI